MRRNPVNRNPVNTNSVNRSTANMPAQYMWRRRMMWLLAVLAVAVIGVVAATFLPRTSLLPATLRQPNPPPFLAARGRDAAWQQDLAYLAKELPRLHVDAFHAIRQSDFERQVADLNASIPTLTDDEVVLRLMALVAQIGDGHTAVNYTAKYQAEDSWRIYPLSLSWLEDGWYVVGTQSDHQQLLGAQVVAIEETPIADAYAAIAPLVSADNDVQRVTNSATLLVTAEVLAALHLVDDPENARFSFTLSDGQSVEVTLSPLVASDVQLVGLQPQPPLKEEPLAQQNPQQWYWYKTLPGDDALYFQYDVCDNMEGLPFEEFATDLFQRVDSEGLSRVVVDLRYNGGGNSGVLAPFLAGLGERPDLDVYVLIGRRTFSSALMNAIELDQLANVTLVGEPTGGRPNHYGEVRSLRLPNSELQVGYSTRYFRMLPDADPLSLEPEIAAPVTIADRQAGHDAALAAALAQ